MLRNCEKFVLELCRGIGDGQYDELNELAACHLHILGFTSQVYGVQMGRSC
jgi:hypothetical protein